MSNISSAIHEFENLDALSKEERWINQIHPLVKFFITIFYINLVVSFHKYDLTGLLGMILYPLILFNITDLSFRDALHRLRIILPVVCIVGVFNPFFDRTILLVAGGTQVPPDTLGAVLLPDGTAWLGGVAISGGVISMLTLMIKAILTVLASYLLIATTSIECLCYALRKIHVPQIIVIEILLIYRYITVLLTEAKRITQAYSLRAPGQKGVAFKAWGPLLGQLLLRSMDRADELYESMCLRGFQGDFYIQGNSGKTAASLLYLILWTAALLILRIFPVMTMVGNLFL